MSPALRLVSPAIVFLALSASPALAESSSLVFTSLEPCRIVDTRYATTPSGPLVSGETRTFFLRDATRDYSPQGGKATGCGVPGLMGSSTVANEARAVAVNVVAVNASGAGHIVAWAANHTAPVASILNFQALTPNLNIGNGIILPMCDEVGAAPCAAGDISFRAPAAGTHLVVDIVGYFRQIPTGMGSALDADTVDGLHAASFMGSATDNWVNTTGDTMTGTLTLSPAAGVAWSTAADVDLRGRVMKGNATFIHSTGGTNTAVGLSALGLVTGDLENTALGSSALARCTSGYQSVAVGSGALAFNDTGNRNVAIGYEAIQGPQGGTASGSDNIGIGFDTLKGITSGSENIALGYRTGRALTTSGNNILIGHNLFVNTATLDNTIRIGGTQTRFFAAGIRGVTTTVNDAVPVVIDSAGQLGTVSSSIRVKDDVRDMSSESAALLQLRPVTFRYKGQAGARHFGLIAEEVNAVLPELVAHSADGEIETVKYHELPAMLLNEIQRQQRALQAQEELITELEARLSRLEGK